MILLALPVCTCCFAVVAFAAVTFAVAVADSAHLPAAAVTVVDYDAPVAVVDLAMLQPVHYL